jgi:NAD(P)-dependent dehydrogenase (short-subunit alcohol dehydrogenase family)
MQDSALIVSASSDIGYHLAKHWIERGYSVIGTYRTNSEQVADLEARGARLLHCDLGNPQSVESVIEQVSDKPIARLVLAAGAQDPIGLFAEVDFDEWAKSIETNFIAQVRVLHGLLSRRLLDDSRVLMFAGGGTNNATTRYSAYTLAKIASIKATELFASEYPKTCFSILGPGWVRTKIHQQTLNNPIGAGSNFARTVQHLEEDDFFPMDRLLHCIDWIFEEKTSVVSGRNFSAVHDLWESQSLREALEADSDLYKLRRHGNNLTL